MLEIDAINGASRGGSNGHLGIVGRILDELRPHLWSCLNLIDRRKLGALGDARFRGGKMSTPFRAKYMLSRDVDHQR